MVSQEVRRSLQDPVLLLAVLVVLWYGSSSVFSVFSKLVFNTQDQWEVGAVAWVTTTQAAIGFLVYLSSKGLLGVFGSGGQPMFGILRELSWQCRWVGLFYFCGNLATNFALAMTNITTTQCLKAAEPLFVVAAMRAITPDKFAAEISPSVLKWLFVVVVGVGVSSYSPAMSAAGVLSAGIANAVFAVSSVLAKSMQKGSASTLDVFGLSMMWGMAAGVALTIAAAGATGTAPTHSCSWDWLLSGIAYGLYNCFSFLALSRVSNATHAILKVGKRIAALFMAGLLLDDHLETRQWVGVGVALLGAHFYQSERSGTQKNQRTSKRACAAVTLAIATLMVVNIGAVVPQHFGLNKVGPLPPVNIFSNEVSETPLPNARRPERKIVLLGPHDRYNFGDLLFEKILSRLLVDRVGYHEDDIIRGGARTVDMSAYGGHSDIISMKKVQEMSRAAPEGPFDIIYTGGESMGCDIECAARAMPDDEAKAMVFSEQIYECAYIVHKDLLLPIERKGEKLNLAIANNLGGGKTGLEVCRKATRVADYVAFRDSDPLAPDCAVMTKELYGDYVSAISEKVVNELFGGVRGPKYVAVQAKTKIASNYVKEIASAMDEVSKNINCTIVFFVAGTVPGHDSISVMQEISSMMTQPSIVYDAENVWKIVALLSRAEAVVSTSLHVRIMAFIYQKPRFTWCDGGKRNGGKHGNFIRLWDAAGSEPCGKHDNGIPTTWHHLSKHFGEDFQRQSKEKYLRATTMYMESFEKWARFTGKKLGAAM